MFKMFGKVFGKEVEKKMETEQEPKDLFYKGIPVPVRVVEAPISMERYIGKTRAYYSGGCLFIENPSQPGRWHRTQKTIMHGPSPVNFHATAFSTPTSRYSLVF